MKYTSTVFITILTLAFVACSRVEPDVTPANNVETTSAGSINTKLLDADALEYYKDIAVLAEWYADHPAVLMAAINDNKTHTYKDPAYNTFVGELQEMDLRDENNKRYAFFDLSDGERHEFLRDYIKLQAKVLDDKFKFAGTDAADDHTELVNALVDQVANTSPYSDTFDFDAEAAKITIGNPYETINDLIEHSQTPVIPPPGSDNGGQGTDEQEFWRTVSSLGILPKTPWTFDPLCTTNTPQQFVDKMRGSLRKGLVLVALPGGTATSYPLVFNGTLYDVGHVAIINKDAADVPAKIDKDFVFTIGTNSKDGMHNEKIGPSWTDKHGKSYLMKPVRTKYHKKWGVPIPWDSYTEDVDNGATHRKITEAIGKEYCSWYQIVYAKQATPNRFICSSSAWWAIKEAHDIGIGNFYKPTIFPAGVYDSGDMRIVAKSW